MCGYELRINRLWATTEVTWYWMRQLPRTVYLCSLSPAWWQKINQPEPRSATIRSTFPSNKHFCSIIKMNGWSSEYSCSPLVLSNLNTNDLESVLLAMLSYLVKTGLDQCSGFCYTLTWCTVLRMSMLVNIVTIHFIMFYVFVCHLSGFPSG